MDVKLYVSSIPNSEKLTSLEFSTFNLVLMSAICEVYNNNKLSQLAHINRNSINSAWEKMFAIELLNNFNHSTQILIKLKKIFTILFSLCKTQVLHLKHFTLKKENV